MTPPPGDGRPRGLLRLVHHHPGRIRMRAEVFRALGDATERTRKAIESIPGVARTEHNAQTGSILVEYTPGIADADAILTLAADAADLDGVTDQPLPTERIDPARAAINVVRGADDIVRELSGGRAGIGLLVPAALATGAVFSFALDKNPPRWPRWDNLAYWAYAVFIEWHKAHVQESRDRRAEND